MTPYILNLCDLALTLYALQRGGVELNPLMRNPAVMVAWKVSGVGAGCAVLECVARAGRSLPQSRLRRASSLAEGALKACTAVYAAACINNLIFIFGGA